MTAALQALIKRFVVEAVRREMTDGRLSSYSDSSVDYAKEAVKEELNVQFATLGPEDFRG